MPPTIPTAKALLRTQNAIDRAYQGTQEVGECTTGCPKINYYYRIHPAMGVARVGGSNDFFIGPETAADQLPSRFYRLKASGKITLLKSQPGNRFKSKKKKKIRRQAARFRIFEYAVEDGTDKLISTRQIRREDIETLEWTVHLANQKATFKNFKGPSLAGGTRTGKALKPKAVTLSAARPANRATSLNLKRAINKIRTLGHAYLDEQARLVVLGGYGIARGPQPIDDYANNPNWNDDVSDGPITAKLKLKGKTEFETVIGAWLMVGPPDYAPELVNVVSLYDTILDVAKRELTPKGHDWVIFEMHGIKNRATQVYSPHFQYDLLRLFQSTLDSATVFLPAAGHRMHPKLHDLANNTKLDDPGTPEALKWREAVFSTIRKPGTTYVKDPEVTATTKDYKETMPMLWGDEEDYTSVRYSVTVTLYEALTSWKDGDFTDTESGTFDAISQSDDITPWGLDRAALERCVGGPFFPGIEASWLVKHAKIYDEPFRLAEGKTVTIKGVSLTIGPGFLSQQMAQPWQADFYACARADGDAQAMNWRIGWWPAQRPDDVVVRATGTAAPIVQRDFTGALELGPTDLVGEDPSKLLRLTLTCLDPVPAPSGTVNVTVLGKTSADLIREDKLMLAHDSPKKCHFYFKTIDKIDVTLPSTWKQARLRVEYDLTAMLGWARDVGNMHDMVAKWQQLGFVVNGHETERDPDL